MALAAGGLVFALTARAQLDPDLSPPPVNQTSGLTKLLSNRPFFGTQPVLKLSGDYVNSPMEDYQQIGQANLPLTLEEMHGVVGELAFGEAEHQGQWQLDYKWRVLTTDAEWQAMANSGQSLTLSDRRTHVLKANYSVRDWWRLGVATFAEDRSDDSGGLNAFPVGLGSHQGFGFQIDTSLRF